MRKFIATAIIVALTGCTTTQIQQGQTLITSGIQAACADVTAAQATAVKTAPNNAKVMNLLSYATAACPLGVAAATLVQNSATLQWLGNLQGQLTAAVPVKTAPAS